MVNFTDFHQRFFKKFTPAPKQLEIRKFALLVLYECIKNVLNHQEVQLLLID